jgi:two-component system cell cycle sensor histidine kinase/response regulator CckA
MPSSRTVLIVDDDSVSRQLIHSLLATENYTVVLAENGGQGLELAGRVRPDVVLLDIVMPDINGYEVCQRLRSNPELRQIPIILLTALEGRETRLQGLAAGADEFLNKPVDPVELRTRVRTITGLNRFRQLSDERARFEVAVAHSPEAIVLTDGEGRIYHANAAFAKLVGPGPQNIFDCFPPETLEPLLAQMELRSHHPERRLQGYETRVVCAQDPQTHAEVTVVRLPSSDGTLLEFILRDVTERKQLEAQVMRLQRIELLGHLAGGIVHDVNNLLMAIVSNAEMLETSSAAKTAERADIIRQSAERGGGLLRRILMFARGTDSTLVPLDIGPVLRETAAIAGKLMGNNISLQVETAADLPAILGDPNQLHQVVMNLCLNARDAMPKGGRLALTAAPVTLTPDNARDVGPDATAGDFVTVSVKDTGVGIAPEIREKLFDPFFTTKPRETSTGLGLATVLRVMRRHEGFVSFETALGTGTCFTCYFPALPDPSLVTSTSSPA